MADPLLCSNCRQAEGYHRSLDLDLPSVVLCDVCSLALVSDRELFKRLGDGRRAEKEETC